MVRSVCLYTCSFNPSGMGVHMLALAERYLAEGVAVSVMFWPAPRAEDMMARAERLGVRLLRTPHPRDPAYAESVISALRADLPDVFHIHVGTGREDFGGARAARAAGVPAVVETLHFPWRLRLKHYRRPFFSSLDAVDQLVTVSEAQKATYARIGVPAESLVTVPNGVSARAPGPGREEARRRLGLRPEQQVVMTVGRLAVMKGHRYLLECLPELRRRFPDVAVVVLGSGHLEGQLAQQAERLGVADVVLLPGHRDDARELLAAADVFVLPSLHEGMPMVILEAMDAGLPVVATSVIGTTEVVQDGRTGRLVPPADAGALGAALVEVLADDQLRARWARAGRRLHRDRFTSGRMAQETLAVYDAVLAASRGASGRARGQVPHRTGGLTGLGDQR